MEIIDNTNGPVSKDGKTRAIIAHITLIGWIIAVVMNNNDKDEYASFYIRQMLGVIVIGITLSIFGTFIPVIGNFLPLISLVLWILSLIGSISEEKKPLPGVGELFQDWFKNL